MYPKHNPSEANGSVASTTISRCGSHQVNACYVMTTVEETQAAEARIPTARKERMVGLLNADPPSQSPVSFATCAESGVNAISRSSRRV
jgi:hypothetical protein